MKAHFLFILISAGFWSSGLFSEVARGVEPVGALVSENQFANVTQFQIPTEGPLRKSVDFWIQVNTRYKGHQGLVHDAKYIDHIYEVLDFKKSRGSSSYLIRRSKEKWKKVLLSLHRKQLTHTQLTEDEKKVYDLFKDVDEPNKFLNAAHRKRLRFQLGQRDHFLEGLIQAGRYLPAMEDIFKRQGMPIELTRLPFVESSFNIKARSKVGASGIWQFMRSTAQLFIQVDDAVDERNDPFRATEAAAKLLQMNFDSLGNWPLAVTAYNHGRKGMMRAVRGMGSDSLSTLVSDYRQRNFGFASRNFFPELMAVVEIEKNSEKYFGKVERSKPDPIQEAVLPDFVAWSDLIRALKLDNETFIELNPGLSEEVRKGCLLVPAGYHLRIPADVGDFGKKYAQMPTLLKVKAQRSLKYGRTGQLENCVGSTGRFDASGKT